VLLLITLIIGVVGSTQMIVAIGKNIKTLMCQSIGATLLAVVHGVYTYYRLLLLVLGNVVVFL
jgi:hypothetical protein